MEVFGWIALCLLAAFGLFIIGLLLAPYILTKIKSFKYKVDSAIADEKLDIDRRSNERRRRDEIKREKDFELANKKLDAKLNKIDKQIKIHTEKLKLADELKKQTALEQDELQKANDVVETPQVTQKRVVETPKVAKPVTIKKVVTEEVDLTPVEDPVDISTTEDIIEEEVSEQGESV